MKAEAESSPPSDMSQTSLASPARTQGGAASHAARGVRSSLIDPVEAVEPRPCPTDAHQATDLESRKPRVPLKEYIKTKKISIKTMTNMSIVKRDRMLKSVARGLAGALERSQSLSKDSQISPRGKDHKTLGRAREAGAPSAESGSPGPSRPRPPGSPSKDGDGSPTRFNLPRLLQEEGASPLPGRGGILIKRNLDFSPNRPSSRGTNTDYRHTEPD